MLSVTPPSVSILLGYNDIQFVLQGLEAHVACDATEELFIFILINLFIYLSFFISVIKCGAISYLDYLT